MGKYNIYISSFFKLLVGLIFIASALLKMSSIDTFELYIFSFNILSLNMAALAARFVIGAELVLGVGYIANIFHKQFYYTILASLVAFTIFLTYLTLIGNEDNCHCFGDLVDISPLESILKNVAIIVMLLLSRTTPAWNFNFSNSFNSAIIERNRLYILLLICLFAAVPFVKHPHHSMYNIINNTDEKDVGQSVNLELFERFIEQNPEIGWGTKTKILALYGTHCKYCKHSAKQISYIIRRNNLSTDAIHLLFWGSDERVEQFMTDANAVDFDYSLIHPKVLLEMANGHIPTVLYYDEAAEHKFVLRNIRSVEERDFTERLNKK